MHRTHVLLAFSIVMAVVSPSRAATLQLSIQNGLVSLDAQEVTVRQILLEWARIGRTQIVNAERVTGGPVTLKFDATPEKQALDIILRAVPGYVAARRETQIADASIYERILVMPTTTTVAAVRQPQSAYPGFPGFQGGPHVTQFRPTPPPPPSVPQEVADSAADQMNDPALAAAAAAGLVPVPAASPGPTPVLTPMMPPDRLQQSPAGTNAPQAAPSSSPWNAPAGTSQPTLAPPAPAATPPIVRPQPPQADR
jgi:hypothetical protein